MGTTFRQLVESEEIIVAPGAYDALSARIIEKAGFPVVYITGLGNEASDLGYPDLGMTTSAEIVRRAGIIASVVDKPVVCDADTGFGGLVNICRTVKMFEAAGVSAIHLEDQTFPKRCGALAGKQVLPAEQFARRIEAAVETRKSKDFVIIARSDAKMDGGVDGVIKRLNLYIDHGADMVMLGDFYTYEDYVRIAKEVKAPLVVCASDPDHFAVQPDYTVEQWKKAGVKMVVYWYLPVFAAIKAVTKAVNVLKEKGSIESIVSEISTYKEYGEIVDLDKWLKFGEKFE